MRHQQPAKRHKLGVSKMREHYTIQPVYRKWADIVLAVAIGVGLAFFFFMGV